jgi:3-dehydroquinate synthase
LTTSFDTSIVSLPHTSYRIFTGMDILSMIGPVAQEEKIPHRVVTIADTVTQELFGNRVESSLKNFGFMTDGISVPPGESSKSLENVRKLYDRLYDLHIGRDTALLALGGGVIGDLTGFVAATYLRGLPYIQVPTTLLAQVDSSVGGKVGVNLPYGKNLVGAFYQPTFVFIDVQTLATLPERELRSGLAEVVKYGMILDERFLLQLEEKFDTLIVPELDQYPEIIKQCCAMKAIVVGRDEKEEGYREILNFGHTVGHAVEASTGYRVLTHGEAITYGMIAETLLSERTGRLSGKEADRLISILKRLNPPPLPDTLNAAEIYERMFGDKKVRKGKLRFTLLTRVGVAEPGVTPPEEPLKEILDELYRITPAV